MLVARTSPNDSGRHRSGSADRRRDVGAIDSPCCGHWTRRHRRDQSTAGRGRDCGLPSPEDTGVARILVLAGDESTGGARMTSASGSASATRVATLANGAPRDRRGSWIPTSAMITTRIMELRKRRGLMAALIVVNIGIPAVFLLVRLIAHVVAPKSYGPAGGYDIFTSLVAGVMYVFGFIVAATLGCTAGSVDLTEGMFRHLVVTGRSRLALYLARIPAGLAIIVPLVAVGFAFVCTVCVLAAPTQLSFNNVNAPVGLSKPALETWAAGHVDEVICNFGFNIGPNSDLRQVVNSVSCGGGNGPSVKVGPGAPTSTPVSRAQVEDAARQIAALNYTNYSCRFLSPSNSLM